MKVSGFTIVRNGIKFDYPIVEAIQSILPICDEMIVSVGNSDDETLALIRNILSPKIKIIESVWDDSLRENGKVLAVETNKAYHSISPDSDWAFYIQADEVFSEKDMPKIKSAMEKYLHDEKVEGLLFNHMNFYASFDYIANSRKWCKNEIRVIRNDKRISSYKDAMSFRKNDEKLKVKFVDATIYHYGWVKHPETQQRKRNEFEKLWHNDEWIKKYIVTNTEFDYTKIDSLKLFKGEHPAVMYERIRRQNWKFAYDPIQKVKSSLYLKFLNYFEKVTGLEIGRFKNYKII
ncbi:MAG: glycosyltransferase family 2 protein [Bacteroidota bacterium]